MARIHRIFGVLVTLRKPLVNTPSKSPRIICGTEQHKLDILVIVSIRIFRQL